MPSPHPKHPKTADLGELIGALVGGGVEFIIVGGAAAVLRTGDGWGRPSTSSETYRSLPMSATPF